MIAFMVAAAVPFDDRCAEDLAAQASELDLETATTEDVDVWRWKQLEDIVEAWERTAQAEDPMAPVGLPNQVPQDPRPWTPWRDCLLKQVGHDGEQHYAVGANALGIYWATESGSTRQMVPQHADWCDNRAPARVGDEVWSGVEGCAQVARYDWHSGRMLGESDVFAKAKILPTQDGTWLIGSNRVERVGPHLEPIRRWSYRTSSHDQLTYSADGTAFAHHNSRETTTPSRVSRGLWTRAVSLQNRT